MNGRFCLSLSSLLCVLAGAWFALARFAAITRESPKLPEACGAETYLKSTFSYARSRIGSSCLSQISFCAR